jgi:hypothetical protein
MFGTAYYIADLAGSTANVVTGQLIPNTVVNASGEAAEATKGFVFTQLSGRAVEEWYVVKYRMGDVLRVIRY